MSRKTRNDLPWPEPWQVVAGSWGLSEGQRDFAEYLTGFESLVSFARFRHREGFDRGRLDAAVGVERPCDFTDPLTNAGLLVEGTRAQARSGDQGALVEKLSNVELPP